MAKKSEIIVKDVSIRTMKVNGTDYLCITDIAKQKNNAEPKDVVKNWMRQKNTLEYLGLWERLHNPTFKGVEFDPLLAEAGSNSFTMSPSRWVELTAAIGITTTTGRNGGTYAITDIAFKFANWVSVEFELYLVMEFQRLKAKEQELLGWTAKRELSKINYRIHTDAIKSNLIPAEVTKAQASIIYAEEADVLNVAMFGMTAKQWREANPELKGNIRDYATINELICLSNIEDINAVLINDGFELPVRRERTASTSGAYCQYVGVVLRSLRYVACLILLMIGGVGEVWGQDYSGVYYIANAIWNGSNTSSPYYWYSENTPEYNWYLVPGANPQQGNKQDAFYSSNYSSTNGDPNKPFLTTFRTNRDYNSIWVIKKTGNYYYLIHALTGKYVKYEPPYINGVSGQTSNNNCHRKAIHLEAWTDPDNDPGDVFKYEITENTNSTSSVTGFNIKYTGTLVDGSHRHFNPTGDNWEYYYAHTNTKSPWSTGMVGLYSATADNIKGGLWPHEDAKAALTPTINVNAELGSFTITPPVVTYVNPEDVSSTISKPAGFLPPGCSIRYTTGDGTQAAPTATTGEEYSVGTSVNISDFSNVKAVIVGYGMVLSNVVDQTVKCATPSISYANNTVTIETSTPDATIYYTSTTNGTVPDDPTTSAYTGTGSSPLITDNVSVTTRFKAIAVKEGLVNSSVASQTVVVNPTIELSSYSFVYTGSDIKPIVTINGGAIPSSEYKVTYSNNVNVGTATATITNKPGGDYYVVGGSTTFTIDPLTATLTWSNTSIPYNKTQQKPTATVGNLVTGDECTVTVTVPEGDGITVGEYTATATALSNTNYALPAVTTQTFNIVQKDITISGITAENKVYDKTTTATLGYTNVTFGGKADGDVLTITATGAFENANVGTEKTVNISGLTLGGTSIANYKLAETDQQTTATANITKRDVTVSGITANNKVYDGTTTATFDCSSAVVAGLLEDDNLTVTAATGTFDTKDVGEGKIVTITGFTMGGTSGDNYQAAETGNQTSSTANITQLEAVLTWGSVALTYNATAQTPTVTVENAAEGDNVTVTVTGEQTNVGENYTATVTALSDTNYKLPAEGLTRNFTIAPAELAVTADAQTKVYGDDDPTLTYTATGLLGSDAITGALVRTEGNNVGEYDISQGTLAASNNYTIAFTGAKFTITAAPLNITADNKSKTNGDADPELTYTVTGLKYGESKEAVLEGSLTREAGEDNGSYAINQGTLALKEGNNNYTISFTAGTFTINAKPLTLTVNLEDWVYGSPNTPSVSGNVSGGKVTYSYKYQNQGDDKYTETQPKAQGSYTVRAQVPATGGYEEATATKNFKINKLALVITADAKQKEYLDEDPKLTYTANLQYDDKLENVVNCVLERTAGENVGEYDINIKTGTTPSSKSGNYSYGSYTGAKLTISVKNLGDGGTPTSGITISANKVESTWTVKLYNGKNEFNASDFTYAESGSDTEGYTITVTGQGNNCCGSATATYNHTIFDSPIIVSSTEKAIPYYVADKDVKTSVDVVPCIVSQVNTSVGTISITPISYIPEGVPVLLLAKNEVTGLTSSPLNEGESSISESLLSSNKLMYSAEETVDVHDAEAYLYYKNEFVLTLEGTIKAQNYYIYNPNYTGESGSSTSSNPAPSRTLSILKGSGTTGIMDLNFDKAKEDTGDRWYSLDGRRLNGKPSQKGIYIKNGKKTVVK